MRFGVFTKVNRELQTDPNFALIIKSASLRELKKHKGKKFFLRNVRIGPNGDDFIHGRLTAVSDYDMFKKPRFVKSIIGK